MNKENKEDEIIIKYLDSQISLVQANKNRLDRIRDKILQLENEEKLIAGESSIMQESIDLYKSKIDYTEKSNENDAVSGIVARSPESTLKILKEKDSTNGMSIKNIIDEYKKRGIHTHHRQINSHLKQLEQEKLVIRINPDQNSFKRYRAK